MEKNDINAYRQKVNFLNQETTTYLAKIKEMLNQYENNQEPKIISYFTYSLNLSDDNEAENLSIGTFHILNTGNQPLTNPYICIKLSPKDLFSFSGKYQYNNSKHLMNSPGAWERLNDWNDKEEYWLKPVGIQTIESSQKISFPDFQLKWSSKESYAGSLMGFVYCDEFKEGVAAVNQINISGTVHERGETNDEERRS